MVEDFSEARESHLRRRDVRTEDAWQISPPDIFEVVLLHSVGDVQDVEDVPRITVDVLAPFLRDEQGIVVAVVAVDLPDQPVRDELADGFPSVTPPRDVLLQVLPRTLLAHEQQPLRMTVRDFLERVVYDDLLGIIHHRGEREDKDFLVVEEDVVARKVDVEVLRQQCIEIERHLRHFDMLLAHGERERQEVDDFLIAEQMARRDLLHSPRHEVKCAVEFPLVLVLRNLLRPERIDDALLPVEKRIPAEHEEVSVGSSRRREAMLVLVPDAPAIAELRQHNVLCRRWIRLVLDDAEKTVILVPHNARIHNATPRQPVRDCTVLKVVFFPSQSQIS